MRDSEQTATLREAEDVAALHRLNALCICALATSDAAWFSEYLSDDFFCTLPDGRRVGKIEYLRRIEDSHGTRGVTFDEIDVRPLGDVAVVQGVGAHRIRRLVRVGPLHPCLAIAQRPLASGCRAHHARRRLLIGH
jgi:Domain of unknown function (DUF4440)